MKAIVFNKKEKQEKLKLTEVEKPVPQGNEVLIKIHAVSVNAADYRSMQLGFIPKNGIFGSDVAGTVEEIGKEVKLFQVGDAVLGDLSGRGSGGFAEYTTAPESILVHKPESLPFEIASTLPMAGMTALQAIRDLGKVQPGQHVLIYGSGGGVGTFSIQFAKYFGAHVTAVCSSKNVPLAQSVGADSVVDYTKENILRSDKKYDVIIAINGYHPLLQYKKCLSTNGILVMVGGSLVQVFTTIIFGRLLSIGKKKVTFLSARVVKKDLEFIVKLAEEGKLKSIIDRQYRLDEVPEAMQYLKQGHSKGKVVISVL